MFDLKKYKHITDLAQPRSVQYFVIYLDIMKDADERKAIKNTDLKNAKYYIPSFIQNAYRTLADSLDPEIMRNISLQVEGISKYGMYSCNDIKRAHVNLQKAKPLFDEERNSAYKETYKTLADFCALFHDLVVYILEANKTLKVLKRQDLKCERAAPVSNTKRGTCSFCFRNIAIDGQTGMAHHGYRRLGGSQSASCGGIRYPAFEISPAGTQARIDSLRNTVERNKERLSQSESWEYVYSWKQAKNGRNPELKKIMRGDENFHLYAIRHKAELKSEIKNAMQTIVRLSKKVKEWKVVAL